MGAKTNISWTASSWNPIRGTVGKWHCVRISQGCKNCYAAAFNKRMGGPDYRVGADTPRLDEEALLLPLRWRTPRKIFVCSMTDLFMEEHSDEWLLRIFDVMRRATRHTFQVLTKRPERAREFFRRIGEGAAQGLQPYYQVRKPGMDLWHAQPRTTQLRIHRLWEQHFDGDTGWPLPNVHLGVSCENQEAANERIPILLQIPAAVRWVSAEPLLGRIDLTEIELDIQLTISMKARVNVLTEHDDEHFHNHHAKIDWVVAGAESGGNRRPFSAEWITDIAAQCKRYDVPFFCKQGSAFKSEQQGDIPDNVWSIKQYPTEVPA